MKDNNYSTVEGILYNLPKLKVEIDNLKLDLEEAQEVVGIIKRIIEKEKRT